MFVSCSKAKIAAKVDTDLDSIIQKMTLEEKVGQMTNLTLPVFITETDSSLTLDTVKLYNALVNKHVGSLQNVGTHALDIATWHYLISTMQKMTLEKTRHKIPFLYCIDAVHGANYINGATLFPHNIGMAATRNPSLMEQCAAVTAAETRASGVRYNFSPVLDAGRNQHWSRHGETFGEDVYLVTQMGTAAIRGYEGTDASQPNRVAACMKHFVGYSVPENGRDRAPAYIPDIVLREYFLPPFREAVKLGTHTLMVNSGEVNGIPVHANKYLLTEVLRKELGFTGVVITDWQDILKLKERHQVAESHKEAVFMAVDAGIDMCIVPFDFSFTDDLIALVKEKRISEERINQSVKRILKLKKEVGLFKSPYIEEESKKLFALPEYQKVTKQAALESITLLKNEGSVLPLADSTSVLLTGPNAHTLSALHGAWSYTWQGDEEARYPDSLFTLAEKFSQNSRVVVLPPVQNGSSDFNREEVNKIAAQSDVILLALGEKPYAETPGHVMQLDLDQNQIELVKLFASTGKPIVVILIEGRPRVIREIEPLCSAIVQAYWPGPEGASALYEVIYGKFNPCGKLPYTYPKYSGTLLTYDHKLLDEAVEQAIPYKYGYEFDPQFPFGHGLSYTTFSYSNLTLSKKLFSTSDTITISVKVKNSGDLDGHEVVELYSRDMVASVTPSVKRLRKFEKIFLTAGEEKTVVLTLPVSELSFVGADLKWRLEPGKFQFMVTDQNVEGQLK